VRDDAGAVVAAPRLDLGRHGLHPHPVGARRSPRAWPGRAASHRGRARGPSSGLRGDAPRHPQLPGARLLSPPRLSGDRRPPRLAGRGLDAPVLPEDSSGRRWGRGPYDASPPRVMKRPRPG
jgi:hypothetical protein